MQHFFKHHNKASSQKILVLLKPTPNVFIHRSYSCATAWAMFNSAKTECIRNAALKKYGLSHLNLKWPEGTNSIEEVNYTEKNPKSISQMYGGADLSKLPIFQGGFINFGYWPNLPFGSEKITVDQRIASSKRMYEVLGNLTGILRKHNLLEIGCGLGYGSALLSQHYGPKLVVGMDISPEQIARAKKSQAADISSGKLRFTIGEAESMPFVDHSFDCVVSVEAAQHFTSMESFSKEIARVLKPGGKLVMASFFPTSKEGVNALNAIVPDYHIHGSQNTANDVEKELASCMEKVKMSSIGKNVWYGFSKWLDQIGFQNQWSKIWCALYEKGLIDYMVYQAESPNSPEAVVSQGANYKSLSKSI